MDLEVKGNVIEIKGKEVNELDRKVAKFVKLLSRFDYIIVSGYIAILFGRTRGTEDIDIFADIKNDSDLRNFLGDLEHEGYYIINESKEEAYNALKESAPIRIAEKGELYPNFEIKLPLNYTDRLSFEEKRVVRFDAYRFNTSSIELQIAYKLQMGSDKDYLDAAHLYGIYEKYLDKGKLYSFIKLLGVKMDTVREVLRID